MAGSLCSSPRAGHRNPHSDGVGGRQPRGSGSRTFTSVEWFSRSMTCSDLRPLMAFPEVAGTYPSRDGVGERATWFRGVIGEGKFFSVDDLERPSRVRVTIPLSATTWRRSSSGTRSTPAWLRRKRSGTHESALFVPHRRIRVIIIARWPPPSPETRAREGLSSPFARSHEDRNHVALGDDPLVACRRRRRGRKFPMGRNPRLRAAGSRSSHARP